MRPGRGQLIAGNARIALGQRDGLIQKSTLLTQAVTRVQNARQVNLDVKQQRGRGILAGQFESGESPFVIVDGRCDAAFRTLGVDAKGQ
jgi:hypothetical protein